MKKAIILGATSGIGKELALQLAAKGYKVGIAGRRVEKLKELKRDNPDKFVCKAIDLTQIESISTQLDELIDALGGLELLVISSGCGEINRALDFQVERDTIDLNVVGFTAAIDYAYNYFSKQKSGHIVGITSVMGLRGSCAAPAYSATKAYQFNYLEALHQHAHVEQNNIIVTDIRPGSVDTDMMKGEGHFWISTPAKASAQIMRAIQKKKAVVYVSKRWRIIGWVLHILPFSIYQ